MNFSEMAREANLTELGEGLYATVYSNGSDKALKIGASLTDGYLDYVEFCLRNQGRKYIPTIHSVAFTDDEYAVVLDRYKHTVARVAHEAQDRDLNAMNFDVALDNGCDEESYMDAAKAYGDAEMVALLKELREEYPYQYLDTHSNNWMYCSEGKLYLTDPFSRSSRSSDKVRNMFQGTKDLPVKEYCTKALAS